MIYTGSDDDIVDSLACLVVCPPAPGFQGLEQNRFQTAMLLALVIKEGRYVLPFAVIVIGCLVKGIRYGCLQLL